jgi:hypothetical protein
LDELSVEGGAVAGLVGPGVLGEILSEAVEAFVAEVGLDELGDDQRADEEVSVQGASAGGGGAFGGLEKELVEELALVGVGAILIVLEQGLVGAVVNGLEGGLGVVVQGVAEVAHPAKELRPGNVGEGAGLGVGGDQGGLEEELAPDAVGQGGEVAVAVELGEAGAAQLVEHGVVEVGEEGAAEEVAAGDLGEVAGGEGLGVFVEVEGLEGEPDGDVEEASEGVFEPFEEVGGAKAGGSAGPREVVVSEVGEAEEGEGGLGGVLVEGFGGVVEGGAGDGAEAGLGAWDRLEEVGGGVGGVKVPAGIDGVGEPGPQDLGEEVSVGEEVGGEGVGGHFEGYRRSIRFPVR